MRHEDGYIEIDIDGMDIDDYEKERTIELVLSAESVIKVTLTSSRENARL